MNTRKWGFVALGIAGGLLAGTVVFAEERAVKPAESLMGGNFQIVARVLSDLVDARYESLPAQARIMVQHATELAAAPPAGPQSSAERSVFLAYATNLRIAASQLLATSERLAKQDRRSAPGDLSVDYLRSAAAQHFGNVVTACALCHSQFRQRAL
jgi:hypothetical protein